MRVAIVTESFLPTVNGVTTSVCRVLEELARRGHDAIVVAPSPAPERYAGFEVRAMPSVPVRSFPVGLPAPELTELVRGFDPHVVHAASPFLLGARGLVTAQRHGIPSVAIYQTDMAAYAERQAAQAGPAVPGALGAALSAATWRYLRRVHACADLTLAPSSAALADLAAHQVTSPGGNVLWGRGVDTALYHPGWRQDAGTLALRRALAPRGELVVGYVGRLAPEKEIERLTEIADLPGVRLAIVGDGPSREDLAALLPEAVFLGRREGEDLARAYGAFDIFVHTGTAETFGQTLQEAAAMGLPVVAPAAGGPLDLVAEGVTGHLFDPDRAGDLRRCLELLTGGPTGDASARRARMGAAACAAMGTRSWSRLVDQLLGHYEDAAEAAALTAA